MLTNMYPTPMYDISASMDEKLKNATIQGDVAFLKEALASKKPIEYFKLKYYPRYPDTDHGRNNIFHFAVMNQRVEFCREALEILPFLDVHDLLCKDNATWKTPLHKDLLLAQDHEILGMIEDYYRRCNTMDSQLRNAAMQGDAEFLRQAVQVKKPIEYFTSLYVRCPIRKEHEGNMLHLAAYHKRAEFFKVAVEILPISEVDILLWQECDQLFGDSVFNIVKTNKSFAEIVKLIEGIYMSRNSMDEQFKKAATQGDIEFLEKAITSCKPKEYFQSLCYATDPEYDEQTGNILHLSARYNRERFLREAMKMLSKAGISVCTLLRQQDHPKFKRNPLHVAARRGYNKAVMAILDYYYANSTLSDHPGDYSSSSPPPWLLRDWEDRTPFHYIFKNCREECALKLMSMDTGLFSYMDDCPRNNPKDAPLIMALQRGFNEVVLKFFESAHVDYNTFDKRVLAVALGNAPNCSDAIFELVLEKNLQLIEDKDFYYIWSPFKEWAAIGKLHPFKYVFEESACSLKRCLIDIMDEENPLYCVAWYISDEDKSIEITEILVSAYKKEKEEQSSVDPPWLARDRYWGQTPLYAAIAKRREKVALHFLCFENVQLLLGNGEEHLFLAIRHKCRDVAQKILDLVDEHCLTQLLIGCDDERTILHDVPMCKGANNFLKRLIKRHPDLIEKCDENGTTVLHRWMDIGELWAFKCILNINDFSSEVRSKFAKLLMRYDDDKGRNPLHVAAEVGAKGVIEHIVRTLFDAIRDAIRDEEFYFDYFLSVNKKDNQGKTPIEIALSTGLEELAFCLLSALRPCQLKDKETTEYLFTAIGKKLHKVVKFILEEAHKESWEEECLCSEGQNVLHVASNCTEENGKVIIEGWPELINKPDAHGKRPLETASEAGAEWLVKLILQKDVSCILNAPLAWVEACERCHLSAILAFVENSTHFQYICQKHHDTPLHHAKFKYYNEYEELLKCPPIQELKNTQDSKGDTPLHKAIKNRNKDLAVILLTMEDIYWNIKNEDSKTALDLLKEVCSLQEPVERQEWVELCKMVGLDPRFKITYIPRKRDLTQMRETISLVAALLATITFTAGFTVPGGFNSDTGEAILTKKAAFVVFLISDTYAMCCSMLILFSIIWSTVCNHNKASFLADRSLELLKHSLYGTLLAFMTGVYTVTYEKSLWTAIVVITMCSAMVILAQRRVLFTMYDMINLVAEKRHGVEIRLLPYWKNCTSYVKRLFRKRRADDHPTATTNRNQTIAAVNGAEPSAV